MNSFFLAMMERFIQHHLAVFILFLVTLASCVALLLISLFKKR